MTTYRNDGSLVWVVLLVLGVIILFPLLMMAFAMPMMGMRGIGHFGGGFSPWWGVGMMLVWLVILLGIGYLVYRIVIHGSISNTDSALEELRHAYARGDLSDEEFEHRRERLERLE